MLDVWLHYYHGERGSWPRRELRCVQGFWLCRELDNGAPLKRKQYLWLPKKWLVTEKMFQSVSVNYSPSRPTLVFQATEAREST